MNWTYVVNFRHRIKHKISTTLNFGRLLASANSDAKALNSWRRMRASHKSLARLSSSLSSMIRSMILEWRDWLGGNLRIGRSAGDV